MAKALNCLLNKESDEKLIEKLKDAIENIVDSLILENKEVKDYVAKVSDVHKVLKRYAKEQNKTLDIDLETVAYLYSEKLSSEIDKNDNLETTESLNKYSLKLAPLSKDVKEILINSEFAKEDKNGKKLLDYVKLMKLTQDELKDKIVNAVNNNNKIKEEDKKDVVDKTIEALKNDWKQIISNALIKSRIELSKKNETITTTQKNAIDKIADLQAMGLFDTFKDDYENAIRKTVGVSNSNNDAINELNKIGKIVRELQQYNELPDNNLIEKIYEREANKIIEKARFKEAAWSYKAVVWYSKLVDLVQLKILNNPFNRVENMVSGKWGQIFRKAQYGDLPNEIKNLAEKTYEDINRNSGVMDGNINNIFTGNTQTIENIREKLGSVGKNRIFSFVSGVSGLNATDNYNKIKQQWSRFLGSMEKIVAEKEGISVSDARKKIHQKFFNDPKNWERLQSNAEAIMQKMNSKGASINITEQSKIRLAGDLLRAEMLNSEIITKDQFEASWESSDKAAGHELGHIANNPLSNFLNKARQSNFEEIDELVKSKQYKKAATRILVDATINKVVNKFVAGGMNWVVLKAEKGGVGIFRSLLTKGVSKEVRKSKSLSELTQSELSQYLYESQKNSDRMYRGAIGLVSNALWISLVLALTGKDDDEEEKDEQLINFLNNNYVTNKAVEKFMPMWAGLVIAKMKQDKIGYEELNSQYKKQPLKEYIFKLGNINPNYSFTNRISRISFKKMLTPDEFSEKSSEKNWRGSDNYDDYLKSYNEKNNESIAVVGELVGSYVDLNPLPTSIIKDGSSIIDEATKLFVKKDLSKTKYKSMEYGSKKEAFAAGYLKYGFLQNVLGKEKEETDK